LSVQGLDDRLADQRASLPEVETAPLEVYLVHGRRIGPSARLLRDFLLAAADEDEA
jgi:hypothetical protein